ncbi:MAG TPA: hypothetical protein VNN20_14330 [Thermodesulfobacteriota bacterium]|nr:hypothetical protein [Thermodesulfobacteriota bacterium]
MDQALYSAFITQNRDWNIRIINASSFDAGTYAAINTGFFMAIFHALMVRVASPEAIVHTTIHTVVCRVYSLIHLARSPNSIVVPARFIE